jgi:hypothetical protein
MSQYVDTATRTFTAGGAIGKYIRVKLSSGKLAAADAADGSAWIGVTAAETFADGDEVAVILKNKQGTCPMFAGAAVAAGAVVHGIDGGEIDDSGSNAVGIALEAATADGDIIEVLLT